MGQKALSLGIALFLLGGLLVAHSFFSAPDGLEEGGILGGPAGTGEEMALSSEASLVAVAQASMTNMDEVKIPSADLASASLQATLGSPLPESMGSVVANAENARVGEAKVSKGLPSLSRYFIQPTSGLNWGVLHAKNAVDIANACGTPIKAAAEGIITDASPSGWNGGYGNYLIIEHPNGVRTKYAHMEKISVSIGDEVRQGELIGTIGNTGYVHGSTGCHLHFEVAGAKNPFAK